MKKISIVIPNYNGQQLLENNLPSIFSSMAEGDELIIVDDASTDDSVLWLINNFRLSKVAEFVIPVPKNYLPKPTPDSTDFYSAEYAIKDKKIKIILLVNKINQRFALTCNKGVLFSTNDWVFLLNSDVIVNKNTLSTLKALVSENKNVFAIGCIEFEDETKDQASGKNVLWFERGRFIHSKAEDMNSGSTAWASGGSSIFNKDKWLKLNGFDSHFSPAYWEDIDLSYRARKKGWSVEFTDKASVIHQHETTNVNALGNSRINEISWKNGSYFSWKHADLKKKLQYILWSPYWYIKRKVIY